MLELIQEHWFSLSLVLSVLTVLWIAAVLSKYVRLMLNIIRDTPAPPLIGPLDFARIEGRRVNFRAFDGTMLQGMFLSRASLSGFQTGANDSEEEGDSPGEDDIYLNGDTKGVVIFCHEYGSDMYSCARYCRPLLEAGFAVFTFDSRSHGASSSLQGYEPRLWCSDKEISDCLGALALVQAELDERNLDLNIGLFGISRGAGAAIMSAARAGSVLPVKAVLADGAFSTDTTLEWSMKKWVHIFARVRFVYENHRPFFWHFLRYLLLKFAQIRFHCSFPSVRKTLRHMKGIAVFFIHGQKDSYIRPAQTRMLFETSRPPRYLWIVPRAKHNQSAVVAPRTYASRTVAFFETYLAPAPGTGTRELQRKEKAVESIFSSANSWIFSDELREESENVVTIDSLLHGSAGGASDAAVREAAKPLPGSTKPAATKHTERASRF